MAWWRRSNRAIPQQEIANSAYRFQRSVERGEKSIVGVNTHVDESRAGIDTLYIDEATAERQVDRLRTQRRDRDGDRVARALDALRHAAAGTDNLMPPVLEAVRAYATLGEMCDALRDVWGEYEENAVL